MTADSFRQKLLGRWLIAHRDEQKVNRFAVLVHGTIQILPRAFHFEIRLTQPPTHPDRALAPLKGFCEQRTILDHPALEIAITLMSSGYHDA